MLGSDAPPILNYPAPPRLVRPVPVSKKKRTTTKRVREKRIESLERERERDADRENFFREVVVGPGLLLGPRKVSL